MGRGGGGTNQAFFRLIFVLNLLQVLSYKVLLLCCVVLCFLHKRVDRTVSICISALC